MATHKRAAAAGPGVLHSCWLCGVHLPAAQMVPDGGTACTDVRWYCRDIRACSARWMMRVAKPTGIRHTTGEVPQQAAGPVSADTR